MGRAVLEIDGDITGLRAAFLSAREESRGASSAIIEDSRRAGVVQRAMWRSVQQQALAALAAVRAEEERSTSRSTELAARRQRVAGDETAARGAAARETGQQTGDAEDEITRKHAEGVSRRKRATDDEARHAVRTARQTAREMERTQRRATAEGRAAGGRVFEAGAQVTGQVLGEARTERERYALAERLTGSALYQAGGNRREVVSTTRALQGFAADHGMDVAELANAVNVAQTEFSVLGNRNTDGRTRNIRYNRFLDLMLLGRNTGNNVTEFGRLSALLSQSGMDETAQRAMLLEAAGLSQRGAIEVGAVTREAMPSITARLGAAMGRLGSNATREERQTAARDAFRQAMAEIEVARGTQGTSAREAGNVMRNVNVALGSDVVQEKALQNIRARLGRNSELEQALFEADPTRRGHTRLRSQYTDALSFTEAFGRVQGNDAQLFQNIFAGGGHGNPLSLLANQRRLLGNLLNADAEGKTGLMRVRELLQGSALTEGDVQRGADIFGSDTTSELARDQARRNRALTGDNTAGAVSAIDRFAAEHPMLAPIATAATSVLGRKVFESIGGRLGGGLLTSGGARAAGGLLGRIAGPVGAFLSTVLTPSNAGEQPYDERAMIRAHNDAGGGRMGAEAAMRAMQQAVAQGVRDGMQQARVTATVTPHDAAHATSNAASSRSAR